MMLMIVRALYPDAGTSNANDSRYVHGRIAQAYKRNAEDITLKYKNKYTILTTSR